MSRNLPNILTGPLKGAPRRALLLGLGVVTGVVVLALAVALVATARPAFLGGYSDLKMNYTTLQASEHAELTCDQCHRDRRGPLVYEAALVGDFYRGVFGKPDTPVFVKMSRPDRGACLACHEHAWSDNIERTVAIPHPAHLRVAEETRDCVECHKWTGHEEEYLEEHKEMPFSAVCASFGCHVGTQPEGSCGNCHHSLQEEGVEWRLVHKRIVQENGPNACLESCHKADQCRMCHTTGKRPDFPTDGASTAVKAIEREHVKKDWMEMHGTYALEDEATCFACHVSVGECEDCHADRPKFHGLKSTWLARHKEFSEDERRCLTCHEKPWCEECHAKFKEMR